MAAGLGGVGLTAVAIGLTSAYYPMLLVLVVMGLFAGLYHPSAAPMLSGHFEASRRGRVLAIHMVGGTLGFTLAPVLGGLTAKMLGWRFAFIILGLPTLISALLVLKLLKLVSRPSTTDVSPAKSGKRQVVAIFQVLRPVAIVLTLAILTQLIAGSAGAFIPLYLVDKHNVAPAYAAMMLGIIRGGGIAGSLFGGWLSDRWGRKNAAFLALVATGPMLFILTKLPFNIVLMVVFALFGLVMFLRQVTLQPLLMDSTPPELRSTVFGIYFGLSIEGMSLAQPIAGHFMDIFGIVEVFDIIALISIALSLVALLLVRRSTS